MSFDALIARMTEDAQQHIAAVQAAADAEVAALIEARTRAESQQLEQVLATRRATRHAAFEHERALAQRRAASAVLAARHALLDRIFVRTESLATAAGGDARHLDMLPRQLAAVLGYLGAQPVTLRCGTSLAPCLRPLLAAQPQLELVVDDALPAGFVAGARDASCTIDATPGARLAALRPQLEAELLPCLPT